jgi:drug/metabolite transporter (DMT)-like permease
MSRRGWILFSAVAVLWGVPYALIKAAVDDGVAPATLAVARIAIGAVVLLALAGRAGVLGSVRGRLRWLAAYGLVEVAVPFRLLAVGERRVSSSLVAVALGASLLGERPGPGAVAGLALILAGAWLATGGQLPALPRPRPALASSKTPC